MLHWNQQEFFVGSNGERAVRYAVSEAAGVRVEYSMHDPTIRTLVPASLWVGVHAAPTTNAKIERWEGRCVVLAGCGSPDDSLGNLLLWRVAVADAFSRVRLELVCGLILCSLAGMGIRLDQHMAASLRSNW